MGQGLFNKNNAGLGMGGFNPMNTTMPQATKQWVLVPAQQGVSGNGVATITPDNTFSLIAHLPSPQSLGIFGSYAYAAYLIDNRSNNGFLAGVLRPVGPGVYQTQFRSPVPLVHYSKVIVSLENPMRIGPAPTGPIVLMVRDPWGMFAFFRPIKTLGAGIWNKVSGLFRSRFSGTDSDAATGAETEGTVQDSPAESVNTTGPQAEGQPQRAQYPVITQTGVHPDGVQAGNQSTVQPESEHPGNQQPEQEQ